MDIKKTYTFDEDGNLKIFEKFQKRKELHESARTLLLLSKSIIEVRYEGLSFDTPVKTKLTIRVPEGFNLKQLQVIYHKLKDHYPSFSNAKYEIKNDSFELTLQSGSQIHSFVKSFLENIDKEVSQELVLVYTDYDEWRPSLMEKIPETEYDKILDKIKSLRLEYFQKSTDKYRKQVLERDNNQCVRCGTDGKKLYKRRNGKMMKNPLQIHHKNYKDDSPNSLMTLCNVCHFKQHMNSYRKTGSWSSKKEDMEE